MKPLLVAAGLCSLLYGAYAIGVERGRIEIMREYLPRLDAAEAETERLADLYNAMAGIIDCESGGKHDVYGDGGRAYGIAQFHRPTFRWLARKSGLLGLRYESRRDQVELLRWALENGYGDHWTCAE